MSIYHLSAKPIGRSDGRSATAAAAYRAGVEIVDARTGLVHDYTRKHGILHAELLLPGGATPDRGAFWNAVELHHKRGDAVLVREVEVSLPTELTLEQRQALAVGYARELADCYGVAADVALHAPRTVTARELEKNPHQYHETDPKTRRQHNGNWHAHILLSACLVQPDGTLGKKAVELDPIHCQRAKILNLADRERARWGELANAVLERCGHAARVDHRSHAERGIEAEPTRHLGPAGAGFERRTGEPSDKRLRQQRQAAERLALAREAGELEREEEALERSILDLSGDLEAALRERDRQRQAAVLQAAADDQAARARKKRALEERAELEADGERQARRREDRLEILFEVDDDVERGFRRAVAAVRAWRRLRGLSEDANRVDAEAAKAMLQSDWTTEEVQTGMLAGSDDLGGRHDDPIDYVRRTVQRASAQLAIEHMTAKTGKGWRGPS